MQTLHIETCMSMTFPKNILWMVSDRLVDYRIRVLAVPPSELREIQTGFFVHWAKNAKYLGRSKKFQTGTSHLIPRGGQQLHEYGNSYD